MSPARPGRGDPEQLVPGEVLSWKGIRAWRGDLVIVTGFKATRWCKLTSGQKQANRGLAAGRAPVEHRFAHLKNWRILDKLRTDPARATHLLCALFVLTDFEVNR
ncbi:transposase family protein [Streptomyces sp. NPDC048411]|uniref:transposase family protein n=1 Tax=Streptomyces sp. NPDC048411 TaxID=3157206 RepID=UPI003451D7C1